MKKCLHMLVSSVVLAGTLSLPLSAAPIKAVALNLEWFPGQWGQPPAEQMSRHVEETRPFIKQLAPDIFIGTEICDETALRDVLGEIPGLQLHVISNFRDADDDPGRRNQQIAIASKLPAVAGWSEPWVQTMDGLRRGFAFVALENPDTGRLVLVYGLHLKSNMSETSEDARRNYEIRDASTRQLLAHAKLMEIRFAERGIDGWIIAGDINTNHDGGFGDNVVAMIEEAGYWNTWRNVPAGQRHTWKGRVDRFAPSTLDYIFLRGLGEPDAKVGVVPETVSDHNAVIADVDLPGATGQAPETGSHTAPEEPAD